MLSCSACGAPADGRASSALVVLKDLIGEQTDLIESTFYPLSRFELSFYRNQVRSLTRRPLCHLD